MTKQFIALILCFTITGCVSTLTKDNNLNERARIVDTNVLNDIKFLILSQYKVESSFTFNYKLNDKELGLSDKVKLIKLLQNKEQSITVEISLATATNKFEQLTLSNKRAEILREFFKNLGSSVKIEFAPQLLSDTLRLVVI